MLEEFRSRILARRPLRLRGGGSKDFYGQSLTGELLDTRGHAGLVDYQPSELVVTARCGTPLAELQALLAASGQMLACEPPSFGAAATVGGVVAAGLSGPRRASAGAVRDAVLGVRLLDGEGRLLRFGGQVMKNVAGYDIARLMAGSLGTLGLIVEVSLKVLPLPVAEATLRLALPQAAAIEHMNRWAGQPLPLSATCWHDGMLSVRLSGAAAAVMTAVGRIGGERLDAAAATAFWEALREQRDAFFAAPTSAAALWRLSVPSTAPPLALPGPVLLEWGGAQRWWPELAGGAAGGRTDAAAVRAAALAAGGHATLFRGGTPALRAGCGVFQALAPEAMRLHRELKRAFDPHGVFNPGRLYAGL
ncbi:MAG: glycolate oxidase subunit GlcE [Gammaproteobacteria bacterium]|nr:glycolate oxidase subunit GlcE [Gammaproteobacteria bacterium]